MCAHRYDALSKSGSSRAPVIGMIVLTIVALSGWGYWAYERFTKGEEGVAVPVVAPLPTAPPKVGPPPEEPPPVKEPEPPPEVKEPEPPPLVKEPEPPPLVKEPEPPPVAKEPEPPPEVKEPEPPPVAKEPELPPEVKEPEPPPVEKEPEVVAMVEPEPEPPPKVESPPEPEAEPPPEPPVEIEPPEPEASPEVTDVMAELEGLGSSRVAWHGQLVTIAKEMPRGIMLQTLSMKQRMGTAGAGMPTRGYTLEVAGQAKSDDSARTVEEFRKLLESQDRVVSAKVTSEMADKVARTVIFEQPFAIACEYKTLEFASAADVEKGDTPDLRKIREQVGKLSSRYVMPPQKSAQFKALSTVIKTGARQAGVPVREAKGTGISSIAEGDRWLNAYEAKLNLSCSFGDVVRLMGEIEKNNPYLAVSSFDVSAVGAEKGMVSSEIALQIPVWSRADRVEKLLGEIPAIGIERPKPEKRKPELKPEPKPKPKPKPEPKPEPKSEPVVAKTPSGPPSWPSLPLKGVSKGADGKYFAIIEGAGPVGAGDRLQVVKAGYVFTWRIESVSADGIKCKKLDMKKRE